MKVEFGEQVENSKKALQTSTCLCCLHTHMHKPSAKKTFPLTKAKGPIHFAESEEKRGGCSETHETLEDISIGNALLTARCVKKWESGHLPLLFGCLSLFLWLGVEVRLCGVLGMAPGCVLKVISRACVSKLHKAKTMDRI